MKHLVNIFTFLHFCFFGYGQLTGTFGLEPIKIKSVKYLYGAHTIMSGYALEIPLSSIGDQQVCKSLRGFQVTKNVSKGVTAASLIYLISSSFSNQANSSVSSSRNIFLGNLVINSVSIPISRGFLKNSIKRYNSLLPYADPIQLKPIHFQNGKYYYDFSRVNSLRAVQVPLMYIEKEEIKSRLRSSKRLNGLSVVVSFVPVTFAAIITSKNQVTSANLEQIKGVAIGSVIAQIGFTVFAQHQVRKAIDVYNEAILLGK